MEVTSLSAPKVSKGQLGIEHGVEHEDLTVLLDDLLVDLLLLTVVVVFSLGNCTPLVVGLAGVVSAAGKLHEGERPGHAVLSTFSGSVSAIRLGLSTRHIFAERTACSSDSSRMFNIFA